MRRRRWGQRSPVALLTDFGSTEYAGVLHGVLATRGVTRVVDLCHSVHPQNIVEAAWILREAAPFFPAGTVFLAVVDPGVGSSRPVIAVRGRRHLYLGPDNGLLYPALIRDGIRELRRLPPPVGIPATFHGRDLMAPAAALLARGLWPAGSRVAGTLQSLDLDWKPGRTLLVKCDRYGNLVTNYPAPPKPADRYSLLTPGGELLRLRHRPCYDAAGEEELFLVSGSSHTLELSVKNGAAAKRFPEWQPGTVIVLRPEPAAGA